MGEPVVETGTWHDLAPDIAEAARTQLRLASNDPDVHRLPGAALAACAMVDHHLLLREHPDRLQLTVGGITWWTYAVDDVPADVLTAAQQLAAELFQRKDVKFGVLNTQSQNGVPVYVSADQLRGVSSMLAPYVEGWGFA